jgi:hypothetical protein
MAHPYSTDSPERRTMPLFIAASAIGATFLTFFFIDSYHIAVPWWASPPIDTMAFYGLFYELFDRWIWKWSLLHKLHIVRVPDISGTWAGSVHPTETNGVSAGLAVRADLRIEIKQSWTEILLLGDAHFSGSRSLSASIITVDECTLSYEYLSEPKPSAPNTMHAHRGIARVTLNDRNGTLNGEYYSGRDRQNIGTIRLQRASR